MGRGWSDFDGFLLVYVNVEWFDSSCNCHYVNEMLVIRIYSNRSSRQGGIWGSKVFENRERSERAKVDSLCVSTERERGSVFYCYETEFRKSLVLSYTLRFQKVSIIDRPPIVTIDACPILVGLRVHCV